MRLQLNKVESKRIKYFAEHAFSGAYLVFERGGFGFTGLGLLVDVEDFSPPLPRRLFPLGGGFALAITSVRHFGILISRNLLRFYIRVIRCLFFSIKSIFYFSFRACLVSMLRADGNE